MISSRAWLGRRFGTITAPAFTMSSPGPYSATTGPVGTLRQRERAVADHADGGRPAERSQALGVHLAVPNAGNTLPANEINTP